MHADPHAVDENLRRVDDDARRDLLQVFHHPLLQKLEQRRAGRADGDEAHEREVLDEPDRLPFGCLRGAYHTPVAVVQLPRLGELALAADGRVEPSKVAQRGRKRESIEHLRHTRADIRRTLRAPVARRERVLQARGDGLGLDRQRELDVLAGVDAPLAVQPDVLGHLAEELAEEHGDEGTGEVHPFVAEVIAVVLLLATERAQQQPVHDVTQKVRLLRLAVLVDADVGEELLLENLLGVLDALRPGHPHRATTLADEVQRHLLRLNHLSLLDGVAEQLHHLVILEIVHEVLQDVLVRDEPERPEHHEEGNLCSDVRDGDADDTRLVLGARRVAEPCHARARRPRAALRGGSALGDPHVLTGLPLLKDVDVVGAHLLLRDEHLLGAVDDEVAALIVRALAELGELLVRVVVEGAVLRPEHDGHLAEEHLGVLLRHDLLRLDILASHRVLLARGRGGDDRLCHVDVQRRGVRQVAKPRLLGKERGGHPVRLGHHGLGQVNLPKLNLVLLLLLHLRLFSRHVLLLRLDREVGHLVCWRDWGGGERSDGRDRANCQKKP